MTSYDREPTFNLRPRSDQPRFQVDFWIPFGQVNVFKELCDVNNPLGVEAQGTFNVNNMDDIRVRGLPRSHQHRLPSAPV
jgi:hypothetical protein